MLRLLKHLSKNDALVFPTAQNSIILYHNHPLNLHSVLRGQKIILLKFFWKH